MRIVVIEARPSALNLQSSAIRRNEGVVGPKSIVVRVRSAGSEFRRIPRFALERQTGVGPSSGLNQSSRRRLQDGLGPGGGAEFCASVVYVKVNGSLGQIKDLSDLHRRLATCHPG